MEKLKTLNEMKRIEIYLPGLPTHQTYYHTTKYVERKMLKEEAIRDVKSITFSSDTHVDLVMFGGIKKTKKELQAMKDYVMWKNNLTEEDLK